MAMRGSTDVPVRTALSGEDVLQEGLRQPERLHRSRVWPSGVPLV